MTVTRFVMIGGFLGAGKTTALARLAKHYSDQGERVALVTNDQAYDLVDTRSLQSQGFDVGEVPGACFCCRFNDLVETMNSLSENHRPTVILAEPVGSCTDLVATVVEPMRSLLGDQFQLGPFAVLVKPEHALKIFADGPRRGFSPQAEYIFTKQIEEADLLALNKIDKLSQEQRQWLAHELERRYSSKDLMEVSMKEGVGVAPLAEYLESKAPDHSNMMELDYQRYAEGEAELGWLNCQVSLRSIEQSGFELDDLLVGLVDELAKTFLEHDVEPAHLKVYGESGVQSGIANLVASDSPPELSVASRVTTSTAELTINARVATDPNNLQSVIESAIQSLAAARKLTASITGMQAFRPAPPQPTHRVTSSDDGI